MKKKNMAMAMASVTAASTAVPAFAAGTDKVTAGSEDVKLENQYNITTGDYKSFETKLRNALAQDYTKVTSGATTTASSAQVVGAPVYTAEYTTFNQDGTEQETKSLELGNLSDVSKKVSDLRNGQVIIFNVTDNGHVKEGTDITNVGKVKYDVPSILEINRSQADTVKLTDKTASAKSKEVKYSVTKSYNNNNGELTLTYTNQANSSDVYSITLKPEMDKLDLNDGIFTNGKLTGFRVAKEVIAPTTYEVAVSNSEVEKITVTSDNKDKVAKDLNAKYEFTNLATAKNQIKQINGKYQVTLFANAVKLNIKSIGQSLATPGTIKQIVLTATNKADLENTLAALSPEGTRFTEIAGSDRIATAIEVSKLNFNNTSADKPAAKGIVLVGENAIVDGLASAPLAAEKNAPILLTNKDSLSKEVKDEILRAMDISGSITSNAGTIYLAGGEAVISKNVENELKSMGLTVKRLSGDDRTETSLAIAKEVGINGQKDVYVVGGYGLADAMSIAPVAAKEKSPIVVVDGQGSLSDDAKTFLNGAYAADVIGGSAVVSDAIVKEVSNATGSAERVYGNDRQETNAKVITKYFDSNQGEMIVSKDGYTNEGFLVDALAAAPMKKPIVLATNNLTVDQAIAVKGAMNTSVTNKTAKLTQVGGGIGNSVLTQLKSLLGLN